jgi:hypothetical protein
VQLQQQQQQQQEQQQQQHGTYKDPVRHAQLGTICSAPVAVLLLAQLPMPNKLLGSFRLLDCKYIRSAQVRK